MKIVRKLSHNLCILVLFLFSNCQNDTVTENQTEEALQKVSPFKTTILSKQDIDSNSKLNNKMRSLATLQQNNIAESIYSGTNDFTINADVANFVENVETNEHSYTFTVSRINNVSPVLENVVFLYNDVTDDYDASLIKYHFTAAQRQEFITTKHVSSSYDITYEPLDINLSDIIGENSEPCTTTYQELHQPQNSPNTYLYSTNGYVQNDCLHTTGDTPCEVITRIVIYCPVSSSSGDVDDPQDPYDPNNTSTAGGNTNTNDSTDDETNELITSPTVILFDDILNCMNGNTFNPRLSQDKIEWLQANRIYTPTIHNYISNNGCDEHSKDFVDDAIEALRNNGEVDFEDQIILDSTFVGKAKCIYNKLKNTNSGFKNLLKRFDGDFPVSHLTFKIDNSLVQGNYGITYPPQNFNIAVAFSNTQLADISDLGAVVCFAHEMIHAEIFRKMLEAAKRGDLQPNSMTQQEQINYVNSLRDNFPGIYDYYIQRYRPAWNHNMMATHYRNVIADILQEFDNSSKPREVYESLSWVGLRQLEDLNDSTAWDALTETEKQTILNNINTYFSNGDTTCN